MSNRSNRMPLMIGLRTLVACLVLGIVTACGGGGSSGGSRPLSDGGASGKRPGPGTISGVAHDGPIAGATINIYEWNGQRGRLLTSTTTDSAGKYALTLSVPRQSLLLESVGGVYVEEATGSNVVIPPGQALFAVQNFDPGQALTGNITYYSTLAAGLAENLVKRGTSAEEAVTTANTRIADILGLDLSRAPAVVNNPQSSTAATSVELGFATAAVSSLAQSVSIASNSAPGASINSIGFIQAAFDDIRTDGLLDGRGANGRITLGKVRVTPDTYRRQIALNILKTAANPNANGLQVNPEQLIAVATRLNNSTDPIFANASITPIDTSKPNIVDLSIGDGAILFGRDRKIAFSIESLSALRSVQLLLNNTVVVDMADPNAMITSLDTTRFTDGEFDFTLVATDVGGASTSRTFKVAIENLTATVVSDTLKAGEFYNGMFDAQFSINVPDGLGTLRYLVDGEAQQTQTTTDPFRFDTRKFADGPHTVTVEVTPQMTEDAPRAVSSTPISINIDNTPPEVTFSLADNTLVGRSLPDLTISATDKFFDAPKLPDVANAAAFLLDGKNNPIPPSNIRVAGNSVTFSQPIGSIPEGSHTFSFTVSDAINTTVVSRRVIIDQSAPSPTINPPMGCQTTQDCAVSGVVTFKGSVVDSLSPVTTAQLVFGGNLQAQSVGGNVPRMAVDLTLMPDSSFSVDIDTRVFPNGRVAFGILTVNSLGITNDGAIGISPQTIAFGTLIVTN